MKARALITSIAVLFLATGAAHPAELSKPGLREENALIAYSVLQDCKNVDLDRAKAMTIVIVDKAKSEGYSIDIDQRFKWIYENAAKITVPVGDSDCKQYYDELLIIYGK